MHGASTLKSNLWIYLNSYPQALDLNNKKNAKE